jgi:hypothetical protein
MITRPLHILPHFQPYGLLPASGTGELVTRIKELVTRVKSEYQEMPGLCLTSPQARRLWALDADTCRTVLGMLVSEGYLRESPGGFVLAR